MEFVNRNKFAIFDKTFYNNKDIIIIDIVDKVLGFRQFDDEIYNNRTLNLFKYR